MNNIFRMKSACHEIVEKQDIIGGLVSYTFITLKFQKCNTLLVFNNVLLEIDYGIFSKSLLFLYL